MNSPKQTALKNRLEKNKLIISDMINEQKRLQDIFLYNVRILLLYYYLNIILFLILNFYSLGIIDG